MKKRRKKYTGFRIFVGIQISLMLLVLAGLAYYYLGGYGTQISEMQLEARRMVETSKEETFRSVETSLVYDANGNLISRLKGEKDVYYIFYEEIPSYATAAIVSIEDKKFYTHPGYDIKAIIRAAKAILENGEVTQGGSTITQQLARNVFLTQERTWQRKVEEIFVAVELEKKYSKDKILEFYLNNIYFGNGYYGIQAASKGYFNKEIASLSLSEIAFLCAIPNNPTLYDPVENIENTLKRRNRILEQMRNDGKISTDTYLEASTEKIVLERPERAKSDYVETYTYYCATRMLMEQQGFVFKTEFASSKEEETYRQEYQELFENCQASLYQKGYRIYTSIDMQMQQELQDSVDGTLADYTETNEEGIYTLQASAVCIDNHTGMVKAIVGGRNQNLPGYTLNRAYQSFRQPGSAIKPLLVYTPALERGYSPDTIVTDEPIEDGPRNADGVFAGKMTLRKAVEKSKNTIAWDLFREITPATGLSYLKKMGFAKLSSQDERLPASLGGFTTGASAVEMAAGYATIANDGNYRTPSCINSITDARGNLIYQAEQEEVPVYGQNAARMMTDMLKGVVITGTGAGLSLKSIESAGKTGTTNENKDGWFVGYTRYYTTSVWVGYDMPRELTALRGGSYPGTIWKNFMDKIHLQLQPLGFLPYIKGGEKVPEAEIQQEGQTEEPSSGEELEMEDADTSLPEQNQELQETLQNLMDEKTEENQENQEDSIVVEKIEE